MTLVRLTILFLFLSNGACGKVSIDDLQLEIPQLSEDEIDQLAEPCPGFAQDIASAASGKSDPFRCVNIFVDEINGSDLENGLDQRNSLQSLDMALELSRNYVPNQDRLKKKLMIIVQCIGDYQNFLFELEQSDQYIVMYVTNSGLLETQ